MKEKMLTEMLQRCARYGRLRGSLARDGLIDSANEYLEKVYVVYQMASDFVNIGLLNENDIKELENAFNNASGITLNQKIQK